MQVKEFGRIKNDTIYTEGCKYKTSAESQQLIDEGNTNGSVDNTTIKTSNVSEFTMLIIIGVLAYAFLK